MESETQTSSSLCILNASLAELHQGSVLFQQVSRGKQCLANCLIFLTASQTEDVTIWSKNDLNRILCSGDNLYCLLKSSGLTNDFLLPSDLPSYFMFRDKYFHLISKDMFSGILHRNNNHVDPFKSLEDCINLLLNEDHGAMFLIVLDYGMALRRIGSVVYFFDSHCRNESGELDINGKAVLISLSCCLSGICLFLRQAISSLTTTHFSDVVFNCQCLNIRQIKKKTFDNKGKNNVIKIHDFLSVRAFLEREMSSHSTKSVNRKKRKHDDPQRDTKNQSNKVKKLNNTEISTTESNADTCNNAVTDNALTDDAVVTAFRNAVTKGPEYICCCCQQTWFEHSGSYLNTQTLNKIDESHITNKNSFTGKRWICKICYTILRNGKMPGLSVANGLSFPMKPKELELTTLEERLVAPRIPFMMIHEKCRSGQYAVRGNVVNVPVEVAKTIKVLPRTLNDNETIPVKLKRKKSYKHHVSYEMVRPNMVFNAAKFLVENSTIFREEGIILDHSWLDNFQFPNNDNEVLGSENLRSSNSCDESSSKNHRTQDDLIESCKEDSDADWSEVDVNEKIAGNLDTLMHPIDFREFNQILTLAPGEGKNPLSLYEDKHAEFLAFPTVYAGVEREDNNKRVVSLYYSSIVKWELRNVDRRVATNIPLLFFKLKKVQIKLIRDKVNLVVRKYKRKGNKLTVGELMEPGGVEKLVKLDEGYRVLRTIRGSPPYWEQAKKDVFAMIRQLGKPTFFCSFSAAKTKWVPLLQALLKLSGKTEMSIEEINSLTWQEKCDLIKSDPVTCVRYFDFRVQKFIKMVLNHCSQPLGQILDFFYRVEFQQRGSPHIHMLLWVANAPVLSIESDDHESIACFVDKYITCKKDGARSDLINYQTHRHARTCRKKGQAICRFGFPLPPMPKTMVLSPLASKDKNYEKAKKNLEKVNDALTDLQTNEELSFEDFLAKLGLDLDSYLMALRSSLKSPKIYLKREVDEVRINAYNPVLLESWEANMDVQFIVDEYSCVSYIVSYISKGQRGMSNLLADACKEAKSAGSDIRQQVRLVGNIFLTHVEVGAQEAVYLLLQMPLRKSSRATKFINTSPPEERTVLLKPYDILKSMAKSATDIECDNVLKQYQRRPKILETVCLADFVALFEIEFNKSAHDNQNFLDCNDNENPETEDAEFSDILNNVENDLPTCHINECRSFDIEKLPRVIELNSGSRLKKRKNRKVIRYVRYNIEIDKENFYREQMMLFLPWRNENTDLLGGFSTFEEHYIQVSALTEPKKALYESGIHLQDLDESAESAGENESFDLPDHDENPDNENSIRYDCFNPADHVLHKSYDLGADLGIKKTAVGVNVQSDKLIDDNVYRNMVRNLNEEHKSFFYHVLHWMKVKSNEPLYAFLSGGAGVGKSVVTRALYQSLHRYFTHKVGENPDELQVLLCAPTGKAAHNIGGNTLHSAFHIPANQGFNFKPLDMQQLNTLRSRYSSLKVVFIDEISMVGNKMFNFVNLRLQEVFGCMLPFGGISVVAIGDLFQLKPVMDGWIFSNISANYGPLASNLWIDLFELFELKVIMRQKEDKTFAELLNRLREGNHSTDDVTMIRKRVLAINSLCSENGADVHLPESQPFLFTTRKEVALHNEKIYLETRNSKCTVEAIDTVSGDVSKHLSQKILSKIPSDGSKTLGLEGSLCLAENIPAEICINIDVDDGLTNGASCIFKKLDFRVGGSDRCSIVWVEFNDQSIGKKCSNNFSYLYTSSISPQWVPILEITRKFPIQYYKSYQIIRRQFPLHLASAKTIHKAQGATMTGAVIDFGNRKIEHIHYVGLSRVQNLSQIHILTLNEEKIATSVDVKCEMDRLREKGFTLLLPDMQRKERECTLKVAFHNTRSLHLHIVDLKEEYNLLKVDILALSETRLIPSDLNTTYELEGFIAKRFDYNPSADQETRSRRTNYGIMVYIKHHIILEECFSRLLFGIEVITCKLCMEGNR